jgi:hypothetical protein
MHLSLLPGSFIIVRCAGYVSTTSTERYMPIQCFFCGYVVYPLHSGMEKITFPIVPKMASKDAFLGNLHEFVLC